MLIGHGGNIYELAQRLGCEPSEIIDMSSNVNPLGPMPGLIAHLQDNLNLIRALPQVEARPAVRAFAARHNIDPETVLAGNGSTQFIYTIPKALETQQALIIGPTYADYADACSMHRVPYRRWFAAEARDFNPDLEQIGREINGIDTVFICNPNNPTGVLIPVPELRSLCRSHPQTRFVIDESYLPFAPQGKRHSMVSCTLPNVIVLNSMSKIFRMPGLRIGFLIAPPAIVQKFVPYMLPWSVNSLAQAAVEYLMTQAAEVRNFTEETRSLLTSEKRRFTAAFDPAAGLQFFPSSTSFLLAKLAPPQTAEAICRRLADGRILIRNCTNFKGLTPQFIRISLKTREINTLLQEKLLATIHLQFEAVRCEGVN